MGGREVKLKRNDRAIVLCNKLSVTVYNEHGVFEHGVFGYAKYDLQDFRIKPQSL